jgi:hypothetical protein
VARLDFGPSLIPVLIRLASTSRPTSHIFYVRWAQTSGCGAANFRQLLSDNPRRGNCVAILLLTIRSALSAKASKAAARNGPMLGRSQETSLTAVAARTIGPALMVSAV